MDDYLTSITLSAGLVFLIVGLLFKIFPPKKINFIYGYRTSSSMHNHDTWIVANKYSARLMVFEGIALTAIGLLKLVLTDSIILGTVIEVGLVILFAIVLIVATEKHLNKLFDKDGKRKIVRTDAS